MAEAPGPFAVVLRGEHLVIPYRVEANAALLGRAETLSPVQREILFCIFSRHYDGHVRERALRQMIRSSKEWGIPFVVQPVGEYVIEIHRVVQDALPFLNTAQYAAFIRENPDYFERTRQRVESYWNCYYRWVYSDRANYPAFEVLKRFDALLEGPSASAEPP